VASDLPLEGESLAVANAVETKKGNFNGVPLGTNGVVLRIEPLSRNR
jgi:hypothetical protein